jgi:hypothetical protein
MTINMIIVDYDAEDDEVEFRWTKIKFKKGKAKTKLENQSSGYF